MALDAGRLARVDGLPAPILYVPAGAGSFGGACATDRAVSGGIVRGEVDLSAIWPPEFRILRTGRGL